jgi:hypothetical protein
MSKPNALVCYSNLLPGSQLANRLLDLGYAVQTVPASKLVETAERDKAMLVIAEVGADVCAAIGELKKNKGTQHVPVLAYSDQEKELASARQAGAALVASSGAILGQLPHLLEQLLVVE